MEESAFHQIRGNNTPNLEGFICPGKQTESYQTSFSMYKCWQNMKVYPFTVLQIRKDNRGRLGIIGYFSPLKHIL